MRGLAGAAARNRNDRYNRNDNIGFRVVVVHNSRPQKFSRQWAVPHSAAAPRQCTRDGAARTWLAGLKPAGRISSRAGPRV